MAGSICPLKRIPGAEQETLLTRKTDLENELGKIRSEIIVFSEGEFPEKTARIETAANLAMEFNEVNKQLVQHDANVIKEDDVSNVFSDIESLGRCCSLPNATKEPLNGVCATQNHVFD